MRRFSLVGLALVLAAGSASAQNVVTVTTIRDCRTRSKTTFIEPATPGGPTLDQLQPVPVGYGGPSRALCCLLADQPALLQQISRLDGAMAGYVAALKTGLDELPAANQAEPKKPDEKKADQKPLPGTAMQPLDAKDWNSGRSFTDANGRRWNLLRGCVQADAPAQMRGWLLQSDGKKLYFLSDRGNLYRQTP
jgi:hypothetical protein